MQNVLAKDEGRRDGKMVGQGRKYEQRGRRTLRVRDRGDR